MLNWLRRLLYKPEYQHKPSATNYLIGDLKWIAQRTPRGQRARKIRQTLLEHGYQKDEVWHK